MNSTPTRFIYSAAARAVFLALLASLSAGVASAQPSKQWAQGDPSAEEQYTLEWINAARADPVGVCSRLLNLYSTDPVIEAFVHSNTTTANEGAWVQDKIATVTKNYPLMQANALANTNIAGIGNEPYAFYPLFQEEAALYAASAAGPNAPYIPPAEPLPTYVQHVPSTNFSQQKTTGATGSNATGGAATYGPYGGSYLQGEQANFYTSYISAREWLLGSLVFLNAESSGNWLFLRGYPLPNSDGTHGNNKIGYNRMAGLHIAGGNGGTRVATFLYGGQEFFTRSDLPFGATNTVFITGAAYQDNNSNAFYDIGEGLADVAITPDHGDWYAVTSASGGYAIPVQANSGRYTLTVTSGTLKGAIATVMVGSTNVKLDWVQPAPARVFPIQVTVTASTGTTQLTGLSTRGLVQTGATSLIGGIVISGPTGTQKKVLIRAVGQSLTSVGLSFSDVVPVTQLKIYDAFGATIATNTRWQTASDGGAGAAAAATQVGDFPLTNGQDSALVLTLVPGGYTALFTVPDGTATVYQTGRIGLLEIYDLTPSQGRFVDISTRGQIGRGNQQMIVGCTISGKGTRRVLIRGIGYELGATFAVPGVLPNPAVTLYDSTSTSVATNDDWSFSAQTNQIRSLAAASGAFSLSEGSVDASLVANLTPGNWSAVVGAATNSAFTGVALVELYETP